MFASEMTEDRQGNATKTVHIVPNGQVWHVVRREADSEETTAHSDLGQALDAATRGPVLVHVVVHSRDAASDAA